MQISSLNDTELKTQINQLKETLKTFPKEQRPLEHALEASAKHIPTYFKIIKCHIDQLSKVMALENHQCKTLDNTDLAEQVQQLIHLFEHLDERDIYLIDALSQEAKHFNIHTKKLETTHNKTSEIQEA